MNLSAVQERMKSLRDIEARLSEAGGGPASADLQFDRARLLTELGRTDDARNAYLALLSQAPGHFGALNNLGALLYSTGFRTAGRTAYKQAVIMHPANPMGHVNLANALLADEELEDARFHFEKALELAPDHAETHQGYARLLTEIGDKEKAALHRRLGFTGRAMTTLPFYGEAEPRRAILLVAAEGGNVPIERFLDPRIFLTTVIVADFFAAEALPPHELIVNAIGDADLATEGLAAAATLVARSKARIVNRPSAVLPTRRTDIAKRLADIQGVRTPRIIAVPKSRLSGPDAMQFLAGLGFETPFLIRAPGFHTGRYFLRIDTEEDLEAVKAIPGDDVLLLEYLDARGADGKSRKYRVMMIGGSLYPLHAAISSQWKIHYFTADMAENPDHRAEDKAFLEDMEQAIGRRAVEALHHINDALGLDYAGIDFGIDAEGNLLLFEANATMVVNPPEPDERWSYRRAAIDRITDAARALLLG